MAGETEALNANAAQRRYWNMVAGPRWVASPGFRERRNQESLALLLAHLGLIDGESVLEIGCGTGALTLPLAEAVGEHRRVVAVDISEPMLGVARQKVGERGLRNVTLLSGDAQVFAFEPAAFDLEEEARQAVIMGPTARLIEAKNPDEATRQTIAHEIEAAFAAEASSGPIRLPATIFLVAARRPL